jgi:type I restriction enzyme S subunit
MPYEVAPRYPIKRLCDAGIILLDCEHRTPKASPTGYPYVAIPNIKEGRLDLSDARLISEEDFISWTKKTKPQAGDIIVTRRARVGDTAVIPSDLQCAIGQNLVILRSDGTQIDQSFLRWALRGSLYQEQVRKFMNVGAVFDSLNCADIPKFEIPVPSLNEQHAIAHILGSLDDKIELNRQMNETLEAMARAIFKSWFVDFDPVRAKAEGREPVGMDAETAALFPDNLEETDLGTVPHGWRIASIGDVAKVVGGSTPSTENPQFWSGAINFATPKDLAPLTSPILLDTERRITEDGLKHISSGLLPRGTVLLSSRAPIGYLAITEIPLAINQGFIAVICNGFIPNYYIFHWIRQNIDTIIGNANGTTFLEISKRNFRPIRLVIPSEPILKKYALKTESLFDQMICNQKQNDILASIRDALLPKLLSGNIQVKDDKTTREGF